MGKRFPARRRRAAAPAALRVAVLLAAVLLAAVWLGGCGTTLSEGGARVELAAGPAAADCEPLGRVTGLAAWHRVHSEPDGPTSINYARNAAAARGADTMVILEHDRPVPYGRDGMRYRTRAEAYRCH